MLEETIKELCRLTKIPKEALNLYNDKTYAYFKNKELQLHHYRTEELEGITLSCITEDDIEVDIIVGLPDSAYTIDVTIRTYCLVEAKKLAEGIKSNNSTIKKAKKGIADRASPCENPYNTQAIIPIDCNEQKNAAGFAYRLLRAYLSKRASEKKKEEAEMKKSSSRYGAVGLDEQDNS